MNLKFKKIASILASAILLGSTVGFASVSADLGAYPSPFVSNGVASVSIVYGADAQASDIVAANLFSSDLASELAGQTAEGDKSTTSATGENVDLSLSSRRVYFQDPMNIARTTLTESHLPTLLAKGKAMDKAGVAYPYRQYITIGSKNLTFGKSGETIDPILHLQIGTTNTNGNAGIYNYTVAFDKNIDVNSSDVTGYTTLKLQGKDYLIGPDSNNTRIYLYGAGTSVRLDKGKEQKVTLEGVEHTVSLEGTETAKAYLKIDGVSNTVNQGLSATFAGDVVVFVKTVFNAAIAGDVSWADLVIGNKKLTLTAGSSITYLKEGSQTTMDNTNVNITGSGASTVSGITISQAAATSTHDYLSVGDSFTDRVFGGVKVEYAATTPVLDSSLRDKIVVQANGCEKVSVTFTSALAGNGGGRYATSGPEATIPFSMDNSQGCSSNAVPTLANDNKKTIHVNEGDYIQLNELVFVNDEDEGRILELISAGLGSSVNDVTKVRDVITNEEKEFATGNNNYTSTPVSWGAAKYYVYVGSPQGGENPNVRIVWGDGATVTSWANASVSVGTQTTLFPRIKLKNGGWMAILYNSSVVNNTRYSLPGLQLVSDYKQGSNWTWTTHFNTTTGTEIGINSSSIKFGNINYTINGTNGTAGSVSGGTIRPNISGFVTLLDMYSTNSSTLCNFGTKNGPAILLVEPKRQALGETNGHAICIPLTTYTSGVTKVAVDYPMFTDRNTGEDPNTLNVSVSNGYSAKLSPNSHIKQIVDRYGTFIEYDAKTDSGYKATISYPEDMMLVDMFIAEIASKASTSETSATGVVKLGDVIMTDSVAESQQPSTNLIVIGGSAVNKVSAKLLALDYPTYGGAQAWQDATGVTGEGQAIIKLMASPYLNTQKAMLVAGWSAADTMAAAKQVVDKKSELVGQDTYKIGTTVAI